MKSGTAFLIAARQCEIHDLQQLMRTSALVRRAGECVHTLQKERGLSNLWLLAGDEFGAALASQALQTRASEAALLGALEELDTSAGQIANGARLYSRVAFVLEGLEALLLLRDDVSMRRVTAEASTAAFSKLIAALLAVVFEAADSATDPGISRRLVAFFHFLQGKELAGQERATGVAAFSGGQIDLPAQQQWMDIVESQERCFAVFEEFSAEVVDATARWREAEAEAQGDVGALRALALVTSEGGRLPGGLGRTWFDACTRRIDRMHEVESLLADDLLARCRDRIAAAEVDLEAGRALLSGATAVPKGKFFERPAAGAASVATAVAIGPHLERSVLDIVQAQSRRLQAMQDELAVARAALSERKVVERAKGLLMAHRRLTEAEAHKMLRQTAMNQNRRLIDVAESVLAMSDFLAPPPPSTTR